MQIVSQQEKSAMEAKREQLYKAQLDVQDRIRKAASLGDLSENAEYHFAKEENRNIQRQLAELEKKLKGVSVVSTDNVPEDVVFLGHTVKLQDLDDDSEQLVRIVGEAGPPDPNSEVMNVSVNSPMGEALMKARVGDTVKVKAPRGTMEFKILEIVGDATSKSEDTQREEEYPKYLVERVQRLPRSGTFVVQSSTPVLSFGDPRAGVATVGINPSPVEFVQGPEELNGNQRRFETVGSLNVKSLANASARGTSAILRRCNTYFQGNPNRPWFDKLEPFVNLVGTSYYEGSACHLDLVQWATDPVWSVIKEQNPKILDTLLGDDRKFFTEQLSHFNFAVILLNGRTAIDEFQKSTGIRVRESKDRGKAPCSLVVGRHPKGALVVGWSTFLQHSTVNDQMRLEVLECVAPLIKEGLESPAR